MASVKPFRTITKKSKDDYIRHNKKPPTSVLDDLKSNPWHEQTDLKTKSMKPSRGLPIRGEDKRDFVNYIAKKAAYFSTPDVKAEDTMLSEYYLLIF